MMRAVILLFSILFMTWLQPAAAQGQDALDAFVAGQYDVAFAGVATDHEPDACAFGARTLLAKAVSGETQPPEALLMAALGEANAALAADPGHVEGRLQKAIALSLLARPMSLQDARDSGYGEAARQLAESVLADDPQNAYAHGFLAVWHIEVLNRGGYLGAMIMGASMDAAEAHYAAAIAVSPGDASLHWQYARALAALSTWRYRKQITAALDSALAAPVDSELERIMQARARTLSSAMATEKSRDIEAMAKMML